MKVNFRLSSCKVQTKLEYQCGIQGVYTFCICGVDDEDFDFALEVSDSLLSKTRWMQCYHVVQLVKFDVMEQTLEGPQCR